MKPPYQHKVLWLSVVFVQMSNVRVVHKGNDWIVEGNRIVGMHFLRRYEEVEYLRSEFYKIDVTTRANSIQFSKNRIWMFEVGI